MTYKNILIEQSEAILTISINRPDKLNALNKATLEELNHVILEAKNNKTIRVIIITGSGIKAFVAGADISEFANYDNLQGANLAKQGQTLVFDLIQNLTKPVIAAVNGFALGGGLELAMAAHFRVASSHAKMGLPEVSLGLIPGYGGTQRLGQIVGRGKALEMILSASMISADEALKYGLVNYVVEQADLLDFCKKLAAKIAGNSSSAIAAAITAVNANFESGKNGFDEEVKQFGACFGTPDFKEGTSAFLEKRKARFA
ncbi:MAG: enoyl-CoA hydratase [Flavobacteriales bacterium CG03_land_8_20_14_0_80_35_15]|nr:enoyl-CoA hydratase [Zetaproteobacteria bacterium]OIO10739.1 MAG: enoyl-CoA hydratase [Flavobacteriaceae bacterium CG1_02_35_72]PIR13879.1 MAG: enoyl-CoA hydratase [Flavobacteriales bacterium CG11_big_fil_rev_8_21_14_0_20_35_7]PIV17683.1 MAG: enoyl-CoA hydratase [Flavobacteriales bacterium CG03_land_8_20_14_0_80_35_15]PIX07109.1 MAG: enoyl-CoA hydratase [Flavobacteriales bacterium CG_4_8_14_3_um_filter_35_10]PJA06047.1 MAG: enoyl-CoA hydratase [Flavobacteriales bacterium CG_4_10_14_0_2_um_f